MARLTLHKRGKVYYVTGTINGVRRRESTGHSDRAHAEAWAVRREAELLKEAEFGPTAVLTFGAAVAMYLDGGGEAQYLMPILNEWERVLMKDIHPGQVIDLANKLYPGTSGATKNRQVITPIVAIFRFCAQRGKCAPIVIKRFETKKIGPRRTASWEWVAAITDAAKPKIAALVLFLSTTAARIDDALRLEWRNVDLERGTATLLDTKNGDDRIVSLLPEVVAALGKVKRVKGDSRVFHFYDRSDVARQVRTACKKAGVEYIPTHGFGRRLFATTMNSQGIDAKTAAEAGGWRTVRMYQEIYAQAGDTEKAIKRAIGKNVAQALKSPTRKPRQIKADKR